MFASCRASYWFYMTHVIHFVVLRAIRIDYWIIGYWNAKKIENLTFTFSIQILDIRCRCCTTHRPHSPNKQIIFRVQASKNIFYSPNKNISIHANTRTPFLTDMFPIKAEWKIYEILKCEQTCYLYFWDSFLRTLSMQKSN